MLVHHPCCYMWYKNPALSSKDRSLAAAVRTSVSSSRLGAPLPTYQVRSLRDSVKVLKKEYDKTEDDLKSLQSVGQIIGEVLRQLDDERCECHAAVCECGVCVCVRVRECVCVCVCLCVERCQ